ncbi:MAG: hypothetical protein H7318_01025 [Oligoflexus sp.]|nr:hypothetical protein [Oligoflexus sp.]
MRRKFLQLIVLTFVLSDCGFKPKSASETKADAVARRILGPAQSLSSSDISVDQKLTIDSLKATRTLAWQTFARVVEAADLSITKPDATAISVRIPKVFTWYSTEDVNRLLSFSLGQIPAVDLNAGLRLSPDQWTKSQAMLDAELDTLPLPLQKKWVRFFEGMDKPQQADLIGLTGMNRVLFSPELIGSVARQFADLQNCFPADIKPTSETPYKPCWSEALPKTSVLIKTTWLNTESGFRSIATDAASLEKLMKNPDASWADAALTQAAPSPEKILTATNAGRSFVLGGMHIMSKELDDWLWITAWWSADPDHDFGEDRPDFVQKLGAPWNQYKICAVSSYTQNRAELDAMEKDHPTLAAAYRAVLDETGASWCSNPYIEKGAHNHKTNCIGCHQFAGTDVLQADVISGSDSVALRFPNLGRLKQRSDFPTDYIWAASQGQTSWLDTLNSLRFRTDSP